MEHQEQWVAAAKTMIDALDLVEPELLPASFRDEILQPVLAGKDTLSQLHADAATLDLLRAIGEISTTAGNRPWYFWEKAAGILRAFTQAENLIIFRQGDRALLHKIHPMIAEEERELHWPGHGSEHLVRFEEEGQAQGFLLRLGPLVAHPLVFLFQRRAPTPFLDVTRFNALMKMSDLLFTLARPHFPHLDLTATMDILGNASESDEEVDILGRDPRFRRALAEAKQAAASEAPVYLHGESGTGKELFARYLHQHSTLKEGPFVPINCSAIPTDLIESELFGHEKGAFTGAYYRKIGKAEQANNGTLFLDEIGEMPLGFQAKLLRFLQEKRFTRVGGNQQVISEARIVVATHRDLKEMVAAGSFREDLYYRIHVIPITISPLRERGGDIRYLAEHFFAHYIGRSRMSRRKVDETVFDILDNYAFPGNVRELDNIIQRTVVMTQKPVITPEDLPPELVEEADGRCERYQLHPFERFDHLVPRDRETLRWLKKEVEGVGSSYQRDLDRRFLIHLLKENDGSARKASEAAKINRTLFYKLLKRAGLDIGMMQKSEP